MLSQGGRRSNSLRFRISSILLLIFVAIISPRICLCTSNNAPTVSSATATPKNISPAGRDYSPVDGSNDDDNNSNKDGAGFIQVLENEVWDANQNEWKAEGGRWTSVSSAGRGGSGDPSLSPSEIQPPEGFEFVGEWKIVVDTGSTNTNKPDSGGARTDNLGWEYQFQYLQAPKRRRIWLRSLGKRQQGPPSKLIEPETSSTYIEKRRSKIMPQQQKQIIQKPSSSSSPIPIIQIIQVFRTIIFRYIQLVSKISQKIYDNWNFKGFGLSIYKSFIFPESIGMALRLPLTTNFEYWDTRPHLPTLSSSLGFYFPWTVGTFLSLSIHVEFVKYLTKYILWVLPLRTLIWLIYDTFLPALWTFFNALFFPLRDGFPSYLKNPPNAPNVAIAKPNYNPEVSERIGCSVSYRWSLKRGFEFRFSYWHSYLPTLAACRRLIQQGKNAVAVIDKKSKTTTTFDWWQKHFGSLGVSTGYPIPVPPRFSCSANLSLSGLYFRKAKATVSTIGGSTGSERSSPLSSTASLTTSSSVSSPQSTTKSSSSSLSSNEEKISQEHKELRVPPSTPKLVATGGSSPK